MSERDFKKWIRTIIASIISGVVILVLTGVFTVIKTNKTISIELRKDVEYLKENSKKHASQNELRTMYGICQEQIKNIEQTSMKQGEKIDRHFEQIMQTLNEMK